MSQVPGPAQGECDQMSCHAKVSNVPLSVKNILSYLADHLQLAVQSTSNMTFRHVQRALGFEHHQDLASSQQQGVAAPTPSQTLVRLLRMSLAVLDLSF